MRPRLLGSFILAVAGALLAVAPSAAQPAAPPAGHEAGHDHTMHHPPAERPEAEARPFELTDIPDTPLVDQHGNQVRFRSDLIEDQVVALNFIFTTCTTICPPQGAIFARLQKEMRQRQIDDVRFVSVSIDPTTDTPERLDAWAARFGGTEDWTLVTGDKQEVDGLLKRLGVFSALKEDHAPIMLLGNDATGEWTRAYGLAAADRLAELLEELRRPAGALPAANEAAAREYFTDLALVDQEGRERRFYTDLIQGRTVVINSFFADCADSCPMMHNTMAKIQAMVGDRLGERVHMLSITVDPANDTPAKLALYARRFGARPGWYFLTGSADNVGHVLAKLGQQVERRESHKSILLVGNDATGLWKKAFALSPPAEILEIVQSVVDDAG